MSTRISPMVGIPQSITVQPATNPFTGNPQPMVVDALGETIVDTLGVILSSSAGNIYSTTATAGIQEGINSLGKNGGRIFIKSGNYTISASISLKSNISLIGEGKNSSIITLANGANVNVITISGPSGSASSAYKHIEIRDLGLNGNSANNTSGYGVHALNVIYLSIINCNISSFAQDSINADNSGLTGLGNSTQAYWQFEKNVLITSASTASSLIVQHMTKVSIVENECAAGNFGIDAIDITQSRIAGNYVHNCVGHGIIINGTTFTVIEGNDIEACGTAGNGDNGMYLSGYQDGNIIIGNLITGNFNGLYSDNQLTSANSGFCAIIALNNVIANTWNGINLNNNANSQQVLIFGNVAKGNVHINFQLGASLPTALLIVKDNLGYNPVAKSSATAGTSPYTFPSLPYDAVYVLTTVGGMTALTLDAQGLFGGTFSVGQIVFVGAGHSLIATWATTAPVFEILPL